MLFYHIWQRKQTALVMIGGIIMHTWMRMHMVFIHMSGCSDYAGIVLSIIDNVSSQHSVGIVGMYLGIITWFL